MFWKFRLFSLFLCVLGDPINQNFIAILLIKILVFVKMKNIFYLKHLQHLQQRLLQWHWVTGVRWRCYMCVCIHIDSWMILFTCYMCVCITWTQTLGWSFLHVTCVSVSLKLKHLDDPSITCVSVSNLFTNIWMILLTGYCVVCLYNINITCYMCFCIP